ncbi:unnamed protein product [Brassica rapa subsp. trilocularis]
MLGRVDAGAWPLGAWLLGDFLFVLADTQEVLGSLRADHHRSYNYRVLILVVIVTLFFAAIGECRLVEAS